ENDGRRFDVRLDAGGATFDVKPGGPRRWTVACGATRVEVVGTRFTVERAGAGVAVSVSRGVVLVRGPDVPNGVARLTAGERLSRPPPPSAPPPPPSAPPPPASASPAPADNAPPTLPRAAAPKTSPSWRALARQRRFAEAWTVARPLAGNDAVDQ